MIQTILGWIGILLIIIIFLYFVYTLYKEDIINLIRDIGIRRMK